jgi:hypothetical protein
LTILLFLTVPTPMRRSHHRHDGSHDAPVVVAVILVSLSSLPSTAFAPRLTFSTCCCLLLLLVFHVVFAVLFLFQSSLPKKNARNISELACDSTPAVTFVATIIIEGVLVTLVGPHHVHDTPRYTKAWAANSQAHRTRTTWRSVLLSK